MRPAGGAETLLSAMVRDGNVMDIIASAGIDTPFSERNRLFEKVSAKMECMLQEQHLKPSPNQSTKCRCRRAGLCWNNAKTKTRATDRWLINARQTGLQPAKRLAFRSLAQQNCSAVAG